MNDRIRFRGGVVELMADIAISDGRKVPKGNKKIRPTDMVSGAAAEHAIEALIKGRDALEPIILDLAEPNNFKALVRGKGATAKVLDKLFVDGKKRKPAEEKRKRALKLIKQITLFKRDEKAKNRKVLILLGLALMIKGKNAPERPTDASASEVYDLLAGMGETKIAKRVRLI